MWKWYKIGGNKIMDLASFLIEEYKDANELASHSAYDVYKNYINRGKKVISERNFYNEMRKIGYKKIIIDVLNKDTWSYDKKHIFRYEKGLTYRGTERTKCEHCKQVKSSVAWYISEALPLW